jgi:hypothetical protein
MRDMSGGIWFMNGDVPYSEDQFNEFKLHLQKLIAEIFSPAIPFNQTADKDRCLYCAYKSLCNRSAD